MPNKFFLLFELQTLPFTLFFYFKLLKNQSKRVTLAWISGQPKVNLKIQHITSHFKNELPIVLVPELINFFIFGKTNKKFILY